METLRRMTGTFVVLTFICGLYGADQETVTIHSKSLKKDIPCLVVLPPEYYLSLDRFTVVYLLHGYSGDYKDWSAHTNLRDYADKYNFIIVCPDGGYNSWYLDSPMDPGSQYRTHIGQEVVQYIDEKYRTIAERKSRAITGLSMGGHGALYLSLEFPHVFGAAGSMSGVVDLQFTAKKYELGEKIGSFEKFSERWEKYSVISNVYKFKDSQTHLIIDCGLDDEFIEINRLLHNKLLALDISHDYSEKLGDHSWDYWVNALNYHFLFFNKNFKNN